MWARIERGCGIAVGTKTQNTHYGENHSENIIFSYSLEQIIGCLMLKKKYTKQTKTVG